MRINIVYDPVFKFHISTIAVDISYLFIILEFQITKREFNKLPDSENVKFPYFMSKSYPEPPIIGQVKDKDIYKTTYDCQSSFGEYSIIWPIPDKMIMIYLDKLKVVIKGDNIFTIGL